MTRVTKAALVACVLLFPNVFGEEKAELDHYSAVWAVVGGNASGPNVSINVFVDKYNTDQEMKRYADILLESGPDGLRRALEKEDLGRFAPIGGVGLPLAIVRKLVESDQIVIRALTIRTVSFPELRKAGRSIEYPYTMLEMVLDRDGKGTGTAIGAAKIRFSQKKDTYELESFQHGATYNKLLDVQMVK